MNNLARSLAPRGLSLLASSLAASCRRLFGAGCGRDSLMRVSTAETLDGGDGGSHDGSGDGGVTDGGGSDAMPTIRSISIDPPTATLVKGSMRALVVTAVYSDGTTGDVTARSMFSTSAANIASVSTGGVVSALGPGMATITATLARLDRHRGDHCQHRDRHRDRDPARDRDDAGRNHRDLHRRRDAQRRDPPGRDAVGDLDVERDHRRHGHGRRRDRRESRHRDHHRQRS